MQISKVIYEVPALDKQISLFKYFIDIDEKFKNSLYIEYPELASKELEEVVTSLYESKANQLEDVRNQSQERWNGIEEDILNEFTNILQKDWDSGEIPGGISLLPFSTRDLKAKRFDVYYKKDIHDILKTTTHEIFHFAYFNKWSDIFPETTLEEMDYPNPIWALSEIALPILLNNSKVIDILGTNFKTYGMFENEIFNDEKITEHIERIFEGKSLEVALIESKEYIEHYYRWKNANKNV